MSADLSRGKVAARSGRWIREAAEGLGSDGKLCVEEVDTRGGGFIRHSSSQFIRISLPGR